MWGLHNGACGIVREIVFQDGHSPNAGHQPSYVVVHFPLYVGPPWDEAFPKVLFKLHSREMLYSFSFNLFAHFACRTFPFLLLPSIAHTGAARGHFYPLTCPLRERFISFKVCKLDRSMMANYQTSSSESSAIRMLRQEKAVLPGYFIQLYLGPQHWEIPTVSIRRFTLSVPT